MLPLKGLRVLAIEHDEAGPYGTMHLADMGAEVIKIEDPETGGDIGRYTYAPFNDRFAEDDSLFFQSINRNKKSITLALKSDAGRHIFERLVEKADAVFYDSEGDIPQKLGLSYHSLRHINPKIICCSLSVWGRTGEWANLPGNEFLVQAASGIMDITGEPGDPPTRVGLPVYSYATGIAAAFAICSGIYSAKKSGQGMELEVSLLQTAVYMYGYLSIWNLYGGYKPERIPYSGHPTVVPSQNFPTQDGWLVLMAQKDKFWQKLCVALDREDLAEDERFRTMKGRFRNRQVLVDELIKEFKEKSTREWVEKLRGEGIPAAPINTIKEALQEKEAQRFIVEVEHEEYGTIKELDTSASCLGTAKSYRRAPKLGEHTESILKDLLAMTDSQIEVLKQQGVV